MKIKSIKLENYRSHKGPVEFKFTEGINLLLGKNGAGKSSILEALGLALFDTGNRSTNEQSIYLGEKTATIEVEFTANDGLDYILQRNIGSNNNIKLTAKGENQSRITGIANVLDKVKELSGLETNTKNLYTNVITAYQNKITSIFSETKKQKEDTFNSIFDTEIYRKIYQGYSKDFHDKLKSDKSNLIGSIDSLKDQHIEDFVFAEQIIRLEEEIAKKEEEINKKDKEIKETGEKLKILQKTGQEIKSTKQVIESESRLLIQNKSTLEDKYKKLEKSISALEIVIRTQGDFDDYNKLQKIIRDLETEISSLESDEKKKNVYEKELNAIISNRQVAHTKIEGIEKQTKEKEVQILDLKDKIRKLNEAGNEKKNGISNSQTLISLLVNFHSELETELDLLKNLYDDKKRKSIESEGISNQILNEDELISELNQLNEEKKRIQENLKHKELIERKIRELTTRIEDNGEAEKVLNNGICPYLKNDCLNIKEGTNPQQYFFEKEKELSSSRDSLIEELKEYEIYSSLNLANENKIALTKNKIEEKKIRVLQIKEINDILKSIDDTVEKAELKIEIIGLKVKEHLSETDLNADPNEILKFLISEISAKKENHKNLNKEILQLEEDISKFETEFAEISNQLNDFAYEINLLSDSIKQSVEKEKELTEIISQLALKTEKLDERRETKNIRNQEAARYKKPYEEYLANINESKEKDTLEKEIEELKNRINEISKKIEDNKNLLDELSGSFSEDDLIKFEKVLFELRDEMQGLTGDLSSKKTEIKHQIELRKKNDEIQNEINKKQSEIDRINGKIKLTEIFRENVNKMGKLVAARLLKKVELLATENYRRISNSTDYISWVNDEINSYEIYLIGRNSSRSFNQLSGGEQVSVAISVRSALASLMTKANFSIFDEPTSNLDSERKQALSESLTEILKNLEQAIIVTHDDAFRDMAQNIIIL